MVNKNIKSLILKCPVMGKCYEGVRRAYLNTRRYFKCARLRRYGCEILSKVEDALKDSGMAYFIDYGTLLGFAREHAFIHHDDDIDYTVLAETATPKGVYERIAKIPGFVFSHAFEFRGQITELTFRFHKIDVDFFFGYRRKASGMCFYSSYDPCPCGAENPDGTMWSAHGRERTSCDKIVRRKFLSTTVSVPENFERTLRETYGSWEMPVVGWNDGMNYGQNKVVYLSDFAHQVTLERLLEIGDRVDASKFETL